MPVALERGFVMMLRKVIAIAALAAGLASAPASAATLVLDGGWQPFSFGDVGSSISPTFEFTLTKNALFKITDAFLNGDQFEVFINGASQGFTSVPVNDGTQAGSDYDLAYASPKFSHAGYALGAGTYSVTATVSLSPYSGGGGAAELVSTAVPEPATWAMMIGGIGLVGGTLRRRAGKPAPITA